MSNIPEVLGAAFEQAPSAMVLTDLTGRMLRVNARFRELSGYTERELLGRNPRLLKSGTFPEQEYVRLWETLTRGEPWRGRFQNRRKDGSIYEVRTTIVPVCAGGGAEVTHYLGTHEDLRELQHLEEALRRSQRLESLGVMAGGIAHEFNNLLTPILGYTDLVRALEPQVAAQRYLDSIERAAQRASGLVAQILAFSREVASGEKRADITLVVRETLKLLRASLPPSVQVKESRLAPDQLVGMDPTHLRQVLMNLCANAYWAMRKGGGTLEVSCPVVELGMEAARAIQPEMRPGSYFALSVRDEGEGIPADILGRVFDPFFSTRPPGESTGLGLSETLGIVLEAKGGVTIESEVGVGTTFTVFLPLAPEKEQRPSSPEGEDADEAWRGSERILYVDSEQEVAELGRDFLADFGYQVTALTSSVEALLAIHDGPPFELLVTAQSLPHLTGLQLAREARCHSPTLPVVLVLGFSEAMDSEELTQSDLSAQVVKPFRPRELAAAVRRALDHPPESLS